MYLLSWLRGFFSPAPQLGIPDLTRPTPAPPPPAPTPRAPTLADRFDSILNVMSGLGGSNDKGASGQVNPNPTILTTAELEILYWTNGYARRIVDIVATDATRKGWYVQDPSMDTDPMADEDRRLQIIARFRDAIKIARIYGACRILIVTDEDIPSEYHSRPTQWLAQPLDPERLLRVRNLVPLTVDECRPLVWDNDLASPNFRQPSLWNLGIQNSTVTGTQVHWTRIITIDGDFLTPNQRRTQQSAGAAVLQSCWEAIRNLTTIDQAGATHSQELSIPVLKIGNLRGMSASDQAATLTLKQQVIAKSKSLLNMIVTAEGDDYQHREISLGGFDKVSARAKEALSAASKMPIVIIFGEAPGGLNTDGASHRTLWNQVIAGAQLEYLTPGLTRLYTLLYRQRFGPTEGREPKRWEIVYCPLDELTEAGRLDLQKQAADIDAAYIEMGVYTADDVRRSRFGPRGWNADILPLVTLPAQPAAATPPNEAAPATPATDALTQPAAPATDLPLRLEIPAGEVRRGVNPETGVPWAVLMPCDYGEIIGTKGLDGEPVDYLRVDGPRGLAIVVEQLLPPDGPEAEPELDEHKVILGCATLDDARTLLAKVYPATSLWGAMNPMPESQLLPWLSARTERRGYIAYDAIDFSPPEGVREELKRGLAWHKEGKSGKGLVPATVAWARRLAAGEKISPAKARKMRAWLARHEVDKQGEGYKPGEDGFPSPGRVAWALWGGDAAVSWSNKLVNQLEAADRA